MQLALLAPLVAVVQRAQQENKEQQVFKDLLVQLDRLEIQVQLERKEVKDSKEQLDLVNKGCKVQQEHKAIKGYKVLPDLVNRDSKEQLDLVFLAW